VIVLADLLPDKPFPSSHRVFHPHLCLGFDVDSPNIGGVLGYVAGFFQKVGKDVFEYWIAPPPNWAELPLPPRLRLNRLTAKWVAIGDSGVGALKFLLPTISEKLVRSDPTNAIQPFLQQLKYTSRVWSPESQKTHFDSTPNSSALA
jgi:hypothetical protein